MIDNIIVRKYIKPYNYVFLFQLSDIANLKLH